MISKTFFQSLWIYFLAGSMYFSYWSPPLKSYLLTLVKDTICWPLKAWEGTTTPFPFSMLQVPITKVWPDRPPSENWTHKLPSLPDLDHFCSCKSIYHSSEPCLALCMDDPLLIRFGSTAENPTGTCCACIHLPVINHPNLLVCVCVGIWECSAKAPANLWGLIGAYRCQDNISPCDSTN